MFRVLLALVILSPLAVAETTKAPETPDELKLRVRVALALSQSQAAACGDCVYDEADARADAMLQRKPLVLLVGACEGRGKIAIDAGAVGCVVKRYGDSDKNRIVILEPMDDKTGWFIRGEFAADITDAKLRELVGGATPKPKPPAVVLDWNISAESKDVPATTVKQYRKVCVNGVCHLEEIK